MKRGNELFLVLISVFLYSHCHAQKQNNIWYFGEQAGLDFNAKPPRSINNGQVITFEGSSSVCDNRGHIQFYSDGISVWDSTHKIMKNGKGLLGNASTTQSATILSMPYNPFKYYIFTLDCYQHQLQNGLNYSIVDMAANGGLGAVITKNVLVAKGVCEGLGVCRTRNGDGYWLVAHLFYSAIFISYKLTSAGLSDPVYSDAGNQVGSTGAGDEAIGYIRISPDGTKIANADFGANYVQLFHFNDSTGVVSNTMATIPLSSAYGLEFSPNSSKLYASGLGGDAKLIQYDLARDTVAATYRGNGGNFIGAIKAGPDGKIYCLHPETQSLHVINDPNLSGIDCNYRQNQFKLKTGLCSLGISNQILPIPFIIESTCFGNRSSFTYTDSLGLDSVVWDFTDASSPEKTKKAFTTFHYFTSPGTYNVKATAYQGNTKQVFYPIVSIDTTIHLDLHRRTYLCGDKDSIIYNITCKNCTYKWENNSANPKRAINKEGKYWVTVHKNDCFATDTVTVVQHYLPHFNLGNDTILCAGTTLLLNPKLNDEVFTWQNGGMQKTFLVTKAGKYKLKAENICGSVNDSIVIGYMNPPHLHFAQDTFLCGKPDFILDATTENASYSWQDGSAVAKYPVKSVGKYIVSAHNKCGTISKSMQVYTGAKPIVKLGKDTSICDRLTLLAGKAENNQDPFSYSYTWQDGSKSNTYKVTETGTYYVTASNYCGSTTDTTKITVEPCDCHLFIPNSFTPNADGINEFFKPSYCLPRNYIMRVFNRWGEKIYETQDISQGWDGRYKGITVPEGAYTYIINGPTQYGDFFNKAGIVYVLK
jgi:gliding motility-associated-like protein